MVGPDLTTVQKPRVVILGQDRREHAVLKLWLKRVFDRL